MTASPEITVQREAADTSNANAFEAQVLVHTPKILSEEIRTRVNSLNALGNTPDDDSKAEEIERELGLLEDRKKLLRQDAHAPDLNTSHERFDAIVAEMGAMDEDARQAEDNVFLGLAVRHKILRERRRVLVGQSMGLAGVAALPVEPIPAVPAHVDLAPQHSVPIHEQLPHADLGDEVQAASPEPVGKSTVLKDSYSLTADMRDVLENETEDEHTFFVEPQSLSEFLAEKTRLAHDTKNYDQLFGGTTYTDEVDGLTCKVEGDEVIVSGGYNYLTGNNDREFFEHAYLKRAAFQVSPEGKLVPVGKVTLRNNYGIPYSKQDVASFDREAFGDNLAALINQRIDPTWEAEGYEIKDGQLGIRTARNKDVPAGTRRVEPGVPLDVIEGDKPATYSKPILNGEYRSGGKMYVLEEIKKINVNGAVIPRNREMVPTQVVLRGPEGERLTFDYDRFRREINRPDGAYAYIQKIVDKTQPLPVYEEKTTKIPVQSAPSPEQQPIEPVLPEEETTVLAPAGGNDDIEKTTLPSDPNADDPTVKIEVPPDKRDTDPTDTQPGVPPVVPTPDKAPKEPPVLENTVAAMNAVDIPADAEATQESESVTLVQTEPADSETVISELPPTAQLPEAMAEELQKEAADTHEFVLDPQTISDFLVQETQPKKNNLFGQNLQFDNLKIGIEDGRLIVSGNFSVNGVLSMHLDDAVFRPNAAGNLIPIGPIDFQEMGVINGSESTMDAGRRDQLHISARSILDNFGTCLRMLTDQSMQRVDTSWRANAFAIDGDKLRILTERIPDKPAHLPEPSEPKESVVESTGAFDPFADDEGELTGQSESVLQDNVAEVTDIPEQRDVVEHTQTPHMPNENTLYTDEKGQEYRLVRIKKANTNGAILPRNRAMQPVRVVLKRTDGKGKIFGERVDYQEFESDINSPTGRFQPKADE
ncbi:MAG: hypothetical protein H0W89_02070 [Candidatus Levybacteria bacterium]|nr:hypothetical protein [Candidatus Levybacteria bacterium]